MGELDPMTKVLFREDPEGFARFLLGKAGVRPDAILEVRAEETVHVSSHRTLDKLLRVVLRQGRRRERRWLHMEVEAVWRATVPRRVYRWWNLASEALPGDEVSSFVVVLKPDARQRRDPRGIYTRQTSLGTRLDFGFTVIRAWEDLDAGELLRAGSPGLLPLIPYAAGASEERVGEAMDRLARIEPVERRADLQGALAIFAGDVFPSGAWLARIPEEVLMKSTTIDQLLDRGREQGREEGRQEGRQEGRAEILAVWIARRLGKRAPAELAKRLTGVGDDVLDRVVTLLATTPSDETLATELDVLLPPAE